MELLFRDNPNDLCLWTLQKSTKKMTFVSFGTHLVAPCFGAENLPPYNLPFSTSPETSKSPQSPPPTLLKIPRLSLGNSLYIWPGSLQPLPPRFNVFLPLIPPFWSFGPTHFQASHPSFHVFLPKIFPTCSLFRGFHVFHPPPTYTQASLRSEASVQLTSPYLIVPPFWSFWSTDFPPPPTR